MPKPIDTVTNIIKFCHIILHSQFFSPFHKKNRTTFGQLSMNITKKQTLREVVTSILRALTIRIQTTQRKENKGGIISFLLALSAFFAYCLVHLYKYCYICTLKCLDVSAEHKCLTFLGYYMDDGYYSNNCGCVVLEYDTIHLWYQARR